VVSLLFTDSFVASLPPSRFFSSDSVVQAQALTTRPLRGGRPPSNHRRVLDGILWICRAGAPWRDLPEAFGNWNSIWRQFRRWCESGVWDVLLQGLADIGGELDALQMIDSTTIRAHRCAAGEKRGMQFQALGRSRVLAAGSPPKSISAAMPQAFPSVSC
jgi:transposase